LLVNARDNRFNRSETVLRVQSKVLVDRVCRSVVISELVNFRSVGLWGWEL
jgi:hypothetical protein